MNKPKGFVSRLSDRSSKYSLVIFLFLLGYMPLHILLSTWIGSYLHLLSFFKIAKDVLLVIGFVLVLISTYKYLIDLVKKSRLIQLILAYGLINLLLVLVRPTDLSAEILGLVYNLRFLLFFIYGILLTRLYKPDWLQKKAMIIVMVASLLVMVFGLLQYYALPDTALTHVGYSRDNGVLPVFHIDDKPDLERIMSTLRDPNSLGSFLLITFAVSLTYLLTTKNKDLKQMMLGLTILALMCLWFTFSRSAWIGAVITAAAVFVLIKTKDKKLAFNRKHLIIGCLILITFMSIFLVSKNSYYTQNIIMHSDSSTVLEDPNELRLRFWQESLQSSLQNPIGYGPGTAGLASIKNQKQGTVLNENYYLQILYENGIVGLILFLVIISLVATKLYLLIKTNKTINHLAVALLASFLGLMLTNFLVHIWSNEAVAYVWWGLAGVVLAVGINPVNGSAKLQKAKRL